MIYDGDCAFCRDWVHRLRAVTGDRVDYLPSQEAARFVPEISAERFTRSVQLVEPDGRLSQGAEAVFGSLAYVPGLGWPLWLYRRVPGWAAVTEWCYRRVARSRGTLSRIVG